MTCEWIEGNLSAFLEDALDPQAREEVSAHIEGCALCRSLLDDYRRDDLHLRALPTAIPGDYLRERIFDSPEYAALTRRLTRDARPAPVRALRTLLPAAALIALAIGAGLFAHERFAGQSGSVDSGKTHTIGGPSSFSYPLAPGQRVIFVRDGALWSAPETPDSSAATASAPQQLTPARARVVAWSVAPTSGSQGGRLVAWVDGQTGALHLVRADGLTDRIVASLAPAGQSIPQVALNSLVWSPDGAHLAFVSADASGALSLRTLTVAGPDTTGGVKVSAPTATGQLVGAPVWSADGHTLAWVATGGASQSVWALRDGVTSQVSSQADLTDSQATVASLSWSGNALTWAVRSGDQITGVFSVTPGASGPTRLTPAQARYTAAALSPNGEWLLAGQGALWRVKLGAGLPLWTAAITGQVSQIVWAPDSKTAALLITSGSAGAQTAHLALWSPAAGLTQVSADVASDTPPAWAPDSQRLAYLAGGQAIIARVQGGQSVDAGATAGAVTAPATLAWAPDGGSVAITDARGVYLATRDGQTFTLITSRAPSASVLTWSTAG